MLTVEGGEELAEEVACRVSSPLFCTAQHWAALERLLAHSLPLRRSLLLNAIGGGGTLK